MMLPAYKAQTELLLRVLPYVAKEEVFALKGGTAINLFLREMPRLSVDIDLTYLPIEPREKSLQGIADALQRIAAALEKSMPGISVTKAVQGDGDEAKLLCRFRQSTIKIEVNTVLRGHVWPTRQLQVVSAAQEAFGLFSVNHVVSQAELFGGKICAALDRQHPRDLFDIHYLFQEEGVTEEIKQGFLVALLSHSRPMHEVLAPTPLDQRKVFDTQFSGMTNDPFTYTQFEAARTQLLTIIHSSLSKSDRSFLLSIKSGEPDWSLFAQTLLQTLPEVQWKLANIQKLKIRNPAKHSAQFAKLKTVLPN